MIRHLTFLWHYPDTGLVNSSHLVGLVDAHKQAYGVGDSELARRIGISRQNLHLWRAHGLRGLPARATLDGVAAELRLPYARVLEAALRDAGYLEVSDRIVTARKSARP